MPSAATPSAAITYGDPRRLPKKDLKIGLEITPRYDIMIIERLRKRTSPPPSFGSLHLVKKRSHMERLRTIIRGILCLINNLSTRGGGKSR